MKEIICPNCNGSGEGQYDGTRCTECKGRGTQLIETDLDDSDDPYDSDDSDDSDNINKENQYDTET